MHKLIRLVDDTHVVDGDPLILVSTVTTMNVAADHDLGPNPLDCCQQLATTHVLHLTGVEIKRTVAVAIRRLM